jgi:hypothetical protein
MEILAHTLGNVKELRAYLNYGHVRNDSIRWVVLPLTYEYMPACVQSQRVTLQISIWGRAGAEALELAWAQSVGRWDGLGEIK